jgi:hypothetical protein
MICYLIFQQFIEIVEEIKAQTTFAAPSLKLWSVSDKASVVKGHNGSTAKGCNGATVQRWMVI